MAAEPEALPPLGNGEAFAPAEPEPELLQRRSTSWRSAFAGPRSAAARCSTSWAT